MTQIGQFAATEDGFAGRLRTVTLDTALTLVPAQSSDTENAPDFRVMMGEEADQIEVGAGWKRVGEKAGAYVAVQIDDPAFACRSEEHTSELQSLMRISYAVFCLNKKNKTTQESN